MLDPIIKVFKPQPNQIPTQLQSVKLDESLDKSLFAMTLAQAIADTSKKQKTTTPNNNNGFISDA